MGYRHQLDEPLVLSLDNTLYLDLRAWLSSRLPSHLSFSVEGKCIDRAIRESKTLSERLATPIEQRLPISCGLSESFWQESISHFALTPLEVDSYASALKRVTRANIDGSSSGSLARALDRIRVLDTNREHWPLPSSPLRKAFALLESIRQFGMLPLATLRRHAEIADHLLKSGMEIGAWSSDRYAAFRKRFDFQKRKVPSDLFSFEFGTRIEETQATNVVDLAVSSEESEITTLTSTERKVFATALRAAGIEESPETLMSYAVQSMHGCVYAEAVVTPLIRSALHAFAHWAESVDLSIEELSYASLSELKESLTMPFTEASWEIWKRAIQDRRSSTHSTVVRGI